jgi:hypothetical protein
MNHINSSICNDEERASNILAPFNPISDSAMKVALDLLHLGEDDVLFDLGAGDCRLLIHAVKAVPGLRCVGIEIDAKFVDRAEQAIAQLAVDDSVRVQVRLGDALDDTESARDKTTLATNTMIRAGCDDLTIHDASAMFLFLVPNGLKLILSFLNRLVDQHKAERRRFRVVTYMFHVPGWEPTEVNRNTKAGSPVYLYEFA